REDAKSTSKRDFVTVREPFVNTESAIRQGHVPKGERNSTLFSFGCGLRVRGFDEERIFEHIKIENSHYTEPLDEEELRKLGRSVSGIRRETVHRRLPRRST